MQMFVPEQQICHVTVDALCVYLLPKQHLQGMRPDLASVTTLTVLAVAARNHIQLVQQSGARSSSAAIRAGSSAIIRASSSIVACNSRCECDADSPQRSNSRCECDACNTRATAVAALAVGGSRDTSTKGRGWDPESCVESVECMPCDTSHSNGHERGITGRAQGLGRCAGTFRYTRSVCSQFN